MKKTLASSERTWLWIYFIEDSNITTIFEFEQHIGVIRKKSEVAFVYTRKWGFESWL